MDWDDKESDQVVETEPAKEAESTEKVATPEPEPAKDTDSVVAETDGGDKGKESESKDNELTTDGEPMVPQSVLGKVAKSIRDKGRSELTAAEQENARLRAENEHLRANTAKVNESSDAWTDEVAPDNSEAIVDQKVRNVFLAKEDAIAREKYGQDYLDALFLVETHGDISLKKKIREEAPDPVGTLMKEATRIAHDLEYGDDPVEREKKKEAALEAKIRKKVESEIQEKLKARKNQPTDVGTVRVAGGDVISDHIPDSDWGSLPK